MRQVVRQGRVDLAVRHSGPRDRRPHLLLLHELFGSSEDWASIESAWPGSFSALDFCGHGASDWLPGRGYSPEVFTADADRVLEEVEDGGPVYVAGAGIGAYVALLLAGGRPQQVRAALLLPGMGLAGGGAIPGEADASDREAWVEAIEASGQRSGASGTDPLVAYCDRDIRPVDYAEAFAKAAGPIGIAATPEVAPPWLDTATQHGRTSTTASDPRVALTALADL